MGASQKKFSMWLSLQKGFQNDIYSSKMPLISPKDQAILTRLTQTCWLMIWADLGIAKWVADGNITVIGHESQEDALSHTHTEDQVHLGHARDKGDNMVLHCQVDQHLWDGGGDEADIQEGQVAKEEVHGAVEPGVCPGDEDDEAIHGHGKAVEG